MPSPASSGVVDLQVKLYLFVSEIRCLMIRPIGATDPLMVAYNESIRFDHVFFAQDIAGSIAFARANIETGILTQKEFAAIENGFGQILEEWRTNEFEIIPGTDEDIHTANERRLGEIISKEIAGKLHTFVQPRESCRYQELNGYTVEEAEMTKSPLIYGYGSETSCERLRNIL